MISLRLALFAHIACTSTFAQALHEALTDYLDGFTPSSAAAAAAAVSSASAPLLNQGSATGSNAAVGYAPTAAALWGASQASLNDGSQPTSGLISAPVAADGSAPTSALLAASAPAVAGVTTPATLAAVSYSSQLDTWQSTPANDLASATTFAAASTDDQDASASLFQPLGPTSGVAEASTALASGSSQSTVAAWILASVSRASASASASMAAAASASSASASASAASASAALLSLSESLSSISALISSISIPTASALAATPLSASAGLEAPAQVRAPSAPASALEANPSAAPGSTAAPPSGHVNPYANAITAMASLFASAFASQSASNTAAPNSAMAMGTAAAASSGSANPPSPSETGGMQLSNPFLQPMNGDVSYQAYKGNGTTQEGWPAQTDWIDFKNMWYLNSNSVINKSCDQSADETQNVYKAIQQVSTSTQVDPRFILAIIMEESHGCVRVKSTSLSVNNPGLMQSYEGKGSCASPTMLNPCPWSEIVMMVQDGTAPNPSGVDLKDLLAYSNRTDVSQYYVAARMYNSGKLSIPADGNLSEGGANSCYAADIANRLKGYVGGSCGASS